ncbi:MAG TPA: glutathione binding-like protein, partial [Bdellovibrio sp.]|nr:glutathione binding-like protein [Bdellovibrio sp.]
LEELEAPYKKHMIDLKALQQKTPEFLEMNPNGRIPVIVDHEGPFNKKMTVFESGAILYYLSEKYDGKFFGHTMDEKAHTMQWLMFQMSGIGPMFGNYYYGLNFLETKNPQYVERFEKESHRLMTVMNAQLTKHTYLAGDNYTIADMATYPWAASFAKAYPHFFETTPAVRRWLSLVGERPAVKKAMS